MKITITIDRLNKPYQMFGIYFLCYLADIVDGVTGLILLPFGLHGTTFSLRMEGIYLNKMEK